ncbi:MAG: aminomethyl-transferring glycine dehydrogenase subunit GcvPB [Chloroflexi bacterium]|nr:aminomethyl-transferring glycine dehydrogenase subunit GcvPB [Chloroflexota bacterium]
MSARPDTGGDAVARPIDIGLIDRVTDDGSLGPRRAVGASLQPTLAELSVPGRRTDQVPHPPADALAGIPDDLLRSSAPALPELSEPQVMRHFTNLSHLNHSIDGGFYPLGSCTMKHNPRVNETAARLPGFARLHPLAPDTLAQGTLELLWELQGMLSEVAGMAATTLQPAAGAHGELTGILVIRAYHRARGDVDRDEVIVPDSSHGTNPATASMAGFRTVTIPSAPDGGVDLEALRGALGPRTAAVMITNPSTLGLFERRIVEVLEATHAAGALAYMDGANMNAIMGRFRPGAASFDVMHLNLHKTFSTPHGGGGPGAGPVAVAAHLVPFLPAPLVVRETDGTFRLERDGERPGSIGRVRAYQGSVGVLVRAYAYIRTHGGPGLCRVTDDAVLAANYLRQRVGEAWDLPYAGPCKHEFVASGARLRRETGVRTLDVAKRLIDHGYHPPTVYFPLIVEECLLIEPTETETLADLDAFAEALLAVAREAHEQPELLHEAPLTTPVRRLDEATAARRPELRWRPMTGAETPCPQ